MKIQVTVSFPRIIEIEVDENRLNDDSYLDDVRFDAAEKASAEIECNGRTGVIIECNECPQLID